jgi:hypothetical protein
VVLEGALAFFTFSEDGSQVDCHVLSNVPSSLPSFNISSPQSFPVVGRHNGTRSSRTLRSASRPNEHDVAIIVEKGQYHAMTAAPLELGYPGYSVIFEISAHKYDPAVNTKVPSISETYFQGITVVLFRNWPRSRRLRTRG